MCRWWLLIPSLRRFWASAERREDKRGHGERQRERTLQRIAVLPGIAKTHKHGAAVYYKIYGGFALASSRCTAAAKAAAAVEAKPGTNAGRQRQNFMILRLVRRSRRPDRIASGRLISIRPKHSTPWPKNTNFDIIFNELASPS